MTGSSNASGLRDALASFAVPNVCSDLAHCRAIDRPPTADETGSQHLTFSFGWVSFPKSDYFQLPYYHPNDVPLPRFDSQRREG